MGVGRAHAAAGEHSAKRCFRARLEQRAPVIPLKSPAAIASPPCSSAPPIEVSSTILRLAERI